jgi:hypothetical protein
MVSWTRRHAEQVLGVVDQAAEYQEGLLPEKAVYFARKRT